MTSDTEKKAQYLKKKIENMNAQELEEYLDDAIEHSFNINNNGTYHSCEIMIEFGGPCSIIETRKEGLTVYWGTESHFINLCEETLEMIDKIMELNWKMTLFNLFNELKTN